MPAHHLYHHHRVTSHALAGLIIVLKEYARSVIFDIRMTMAMTMTSLRQQPHKKSIHHGGGK
jgi:hypothetical protein